jgi:hypothetical protein
MVDRNLDGLVTILESFVNLRDLYKNFSPALKTTIDDWLHFKKEAKKSDDLCQPSAWWLDNYATFCGHERRIW